MTKRLRRLVVLSFGAALCAAAAASAAPFRPALTNVPFTQISDAAAKAAQQSPVCPNGRVCYTPSFIKQAYDVPTDKKAPTGAGQTILIVEAFGSPFIQSDLAQFDAENGLPDPPSLTILNQQTPTAGGNPNPNLMLWAIETSLDVEYAHAMAPGADIVVAVANSDDSPDLSQMVKEAAAQYPRAIMSQSFGQDETGDFSDPDAATVMQQAYLSMVLEGGTVLASSGDYGASNFVGLFGDAPVPMASFPAVSPLVVAVGGTMGNPAPGGLWNNGRYGGEQVWNEILPDVFPGAGATGGAPSVVYRAPFWQLGVTGSSMRSEPDVSFNSAFDGGVVVVFGGKHGVVGGTSAAAPQWAGIIALANELRGRRGALPLGIATPQLYLLARDKNDYKQDFHDITVGGNALFGSLYGLPGFAAAPGYDLPTGLGTPVVSKLLKDLSGRDAGRVSFDGFDLRGHGKGKHVRLNPGG